MWWKQSSQQISRGVYEEDLSRTDTKTEDFRARVRFPRDWKEITILIWTVHFQILKGSLESQFCNYWSNMQLKLNWSWFSVGRISRLLIVCVIQHYPSTLYYGTLWDLVFHQAQAWPHHGWSVTMLSGSTCQYEDGGNRYKPDITRPKKSRNSMELHRPAMIFVAYWDNCSLQPCLPLALRRSLNKRHSQRWATAVAATVTTGPLSRDRVHLVAFLGHSCCCTEIQFLIFCIIQGCGGSAPEQDRVRRKAKDKSAEQITIACSNLPARNHFGIQETWIRSPACFVFQSIWNV